LGQVPFRTGMAGGSAEVLHPAAASQLFGKRGPCTHSRALTDPIAAG